MLTGKRILLQRVQGYINKRYPNWNLDVALRYLPVADHLNRTSPARVLDVGPGDEGLSRYWGRQTFGVDVCMPTAKGISPTRRICGSATALPFKDGSMDVVVCVDVLEHIPECDRTRVLSEMIRVARKELILAFPCGPAAHRVEKRLEETYERRNRSPHPYLHEHLKYGLPEADLLDQDIRSLATERHRNVQVREQKNVNLRLWHAFFHLYFIGGPKLQRLISYYLLVLIPILRHVHWGTPYRRFLFVRLGSGGG